jgi:hypothetical protein
MSQLRSVGGFQPLGILPSPVSTSRFPEPRYGPLHAFRFTTAVAQRRVWVITLPLSCLAMCEHRNFRPVRAPWSPSPCTRSLHRCPLRCRSFLFRFGSGGRFHRSRGFPDRPASASRLPNAGTSHATLLSFANALVTRRRVQVYTLPLSAPGSLSAPWPPSTSTRLPSIAERSRSSLASVFPACAGTFSTRVGRQFRRSFRWLSFAVALPSRDSQA